MTEDTTPYETATQHGCYSAFGAGISSGAPTVMCDCGRMFQGETWEQAIDAYTLHVVEIVREPAPSEARPQPEGAEETAEGPLVTYEAVNTTYSGEFNRIGDYDVYGDKMSFEQAAVPESDSGEER